MVKQTKKQMIKELGNRKVKLVSGKWVQGDQFNFRNFKKDEVAQLLKGSIKK